MYDYSGSLYENASSVEKNIVESDYEVLLDELVGDLIWNYCYEIHRAVKLGYYTDLESDSTIKINHEVSEKRNGKKPKKKIAVEYCCPICSKNGCATKYVTHLNKCTGGGKSRPASQKSQNYEERSSSEDDADYISSVVSSETSGDYPSTNYEELVLYFQKKCGAFCKSGKLCTRSSNCRQHKPDQRRNARLQLLPQDYYEFVNGREIGENAIYKANGAQIDVDTADSPTYA